MKKLVSFLCAAVMGFTLVSTVMANGSIVNPIGDVPVKVSAELQAVIGERNVIEITDTAAKVDEIKKSNYSEANQEALEEIAKTGTLESFQGEVQTVGNVDPDKVKFSGETTLNVTNSDGEIQEEGSVVFEDEADMPTVDVEAAKLFTEEELKAFADGTATPVFGFMIEDESGEMKCVLVEGTYDPATGNITLKIPATNVCVYPGSQEK